VHNVQIKQLKLMVSFQTVSWIGSLCGLCLHCFNLLPPLKPLFKWLTRTQCIFFPPNIAIEGSTRLFYIWEVPVEISARRPIVLFFVIEMRFVNKHCSGDGHFIGYAFQFINSIKAVYQFCYFCKLHMLILLQTYF
jgi:hypothetical protein